MVFDFTYLRSVVLNVGRGKILVGVEVEDIMNQFWWEYIMKIHLPTIRLIGKAGSLVYSSRTTIKAC